ncbi:dnaJ homolog subfamily C member 27 [Lingula anatina]|uniref:DnaJ homolog subfamily C member 27 n=1 Tax=Lingula anatina TaxID=7574 RepID=A0A1S3IHJ4_LINAN|nr:dnaJ homolog subfamily C member 27 [Lingula anatina]|eukprot:XP_013397687.1 dnaJ homolog subfamily C member 27 [Lingula anatina]
MDRKPGHLTKKVPDVAKTLIWVKIVGIGNAGIGKTCIIKNFCESKFNSGYQPTVGVDYGFKIQSIQGVDLRVHLWDLSGNQEYTDVRNELYGDTDAVFLAYDVTNEASYEALDGWLKEWNKYGPQTAEVTLVGNKTDLKPKRVVSMADGKKWANAHKFNYYETSASTGEGVEKMFHDLLVTVMKKRKLLPKD